MGIFIIGIIIGVALMYGALEKRFKSWLRGIFAVSGFVCITAMLFFAFADPFCISEAPALVDTYELIAVKEGDEIYSTEKTMIIRGNQIKLEVRYDMPAESENLINLFLDNENGKLYYLMEEKIAITSISNVANTNYDDIHCYEVEVINGNHAKLYVEKYEQKTKMTFLSMGIFTKVKYKLYIPDETSNQ